MAKHKHNTGHDIPEFPPTLNISEKFLPEIKTWEVGQKYTIVLEAEQVALSQRDDGKFEARFEVKEASTPSAQGISSKKHSQAELANITAGSKFKAVQTEFALGRLKDRAGKKVTNRDQAFAISISEQERVNKK